MTDSVSTALLTSVAEKRRSHLQLFIIRNDLRSGGTVGPVLSSATRVRAINAGLPQLNMHSFRATTGALDPGLAAKIFRGFFDTFESVYREFERLERGADGVTNSEFHDARVKKR